MSAVRKLRKVGTPRVACAVDKVAQCRAGSSSCISEDDPLAQSQGYKQDAAKVDKIKFPWFKTGWAVERQARGPG